LVFFYYSYREVANSAISALSLFSKHNSLCTVFKVMEKSENLYTDDNPETTISGLGFKDEEKARESITKLTKLIDKKEITKTHAIQAAISMEQRSKHHPHRNENMKAAEKIYRAFINKHKTSTS